MRRRGRPAPWTPPIVWKRLALGLGAFLSSLGLLSATWWAAPRVWLAMHDHPYFAISQITVRGNSRLSRAQLLGWAGLHPGSSIWDASPESVRARLLEHPDLADADVRRDFPHRLVISVHERSPLAIVVLDDLYYVDRGGHLMDRLRDSDSRDLPLITGLRMAEMNGRGPLLLQRATRLIRLCLREGCGDSLSEVNVDADRGVTIIPLHRPVAILLGWGDWRTKLAHTTRVLAAWEGQESRLAQLDATFANQIIVRLRQQPDDKSHKHGRRETRAGVRT
jgi:cell division protein FtsQ